MKATLALVPVVSVFFAVATSYVYEEISSTPAHPQGSESALEQNRLEKSLSAVQEKLDEALTRLAALESTRQAPTSTDAGSTNAAGRGITAGESSSASRNPESDQGKVTVAVERQLAAVLRDVDGKSALRDYVVDVIESERESLEQRRRESAEARRRERRELAQGPYGRHNYRVNSIGKRLSLNDAQKDVYFDLLERYGKERQQLHKDPDGRSILSSLQGDPEQIAKHFQQVREQEQALQRRFDEEFSESLTADQFDRYRQLPEHEKRGFGAPMIFSEAISTDGEQHRMIYAPPTNTSLGEGNLPQGVAVEAIRAVKSAIVEIEVNENGEAQPGAGETTDPEN